MTGNPYPWLAIIAFVALTLVLKGYIKLPAGLNPFARQAAPQPSSPVVYQEVKPTDAALLERLDSHTLGVYFALAKRREAEAELAHKIAADAAEQIKATFTAPFVPPGSAGQDPNAAGVKP